MPLQDYIQEENQSFDETTMASFNPENYNSGTFGKFVGNLIQNVAEMIGADEESQARWNALPQYEKINLIMQNGVLGTVGRIKDLKMYFKKPDPKLVMEGYEKIVREPLRNAYNNELSRISSQKSKLNEIQDKLEQGLENRIPLTKYGETPDPDQEKWARLLQEFKDRMGYK